MHRMDRHARGRAGLLAGLTLTVLVLAGAGSASAQERGPGCDVLIPDHCLLPWPNDRFTVPDERTDTGRRVALDPAAMPRNAGGTAIDPTDFNRSDGFSPGQTIVVKVPGLDTPAALRATGAVPVTDIARSFDRRQPVLLVDARTGRRHPIWAELDANATTPTSTALLIHPARNLEEGRRYVVALRRLRDAAGRRLRPTAAFRALRDGRRTRDAAVERRRPQLERVFRTLRRAGVARHDLHLAWDFTVASERSLTARMLHLRDRAFAQLGDRDLSDLRVEGAAPPFTVDQVEELRPCGADGCQDGESDDVLRRVRGSVSVPCFLDAPGCPPGSRFRLAPGPGALPRQTPGNVRRAGFVCSVPRSAVAGGVARLARPTLYGHGLFGRAEQITSSVAGAFQDEHTFVGCAADFIGMSREDIPNAITILQDLSRFPTLVDRVQQGMLDFLLLGRAMIHPAGLSAHPAFRWQGRPLIDTRRLFYTGGSQGGIIGGALTAVAPDFTRAYLGVPGMNYSLLLNRSIDFDVYAAVLNPAYPDPLQRQLVLSIVQMLWDRGEANGYAHHMTDDPLPRTPAHRVLLQMAFGDHQVTNVATEVEARTIGARVRAPVLDPGRSPDVRPLWGIPRIGRFPFRGPAALVVWDIGPLRTEGGEEKGTPPPPTTNTPNRLGVDPHGPDASEEITGRRQVAEFLRPGGAVVDVCGPAPCYLDGWRGPGG